jgi:hypothetical protein
MSGMNFMDEDNSVDMKQVRCNLKDLYPALILLALSVVCYWKMFDNYFYLDDTNGVFAGYLLNHDITKIFTYNFEAIYMSPLRRVVVALSYIPNYLISGYDPWSYYLTNLLLHFGNSLLVYLIVKKLSDNKNMALLTAVLFSASFNKADAVMMIAHRTTLMGAFFALLSVFLYIRIIMEGYSRRLFLYTFLSFVAALGSYETGLVLPGIFIALGLIYKWREFFNKELLLANASFLSLAIILVLSLGLQAGAAIAETSIIGKIFHIFRNMLAVFPSFIIPPFVLQQPNEVYHSTTTYIGWIELFSVGLIVLIVIANVKIQDRLIYFGLLFFLITSIPTSTVNWAYYPDLPAWRMRFSIGKYSYLSSFGFYVIAGALLYRFFNFLVKQQLDRNLLKYAMAFLLGVYFAFNIHWLYERERDWDRNTRKAKNQIDSLKSMQLNIADYTDIYVGQPSYSNAELVLYSKHAESLLRVIFDRPELVVKDLSDKLDSVHVLFLVPDDKGGMEAIEIVSIQGTLYTRKIR